MRRCRGLPLLELVPGGCRGTLGWGGVGVSVVHWFALIWRSLSWTRIHQASPRLLFTCPVKESHKRSPAATLCAQCDALSYCNTTAGEASTLLLPGFSCLLTGDTLEGLQQRTAAYILKGPAVAWVGGLWSPQQAQQESAGAEPSGRKLLGRAGSRSLASQRHSSGSRSAAGVSLPAPLRQLGGGAADSGSGSDSGSRRRALLQGGDAAAADGIWLHFTRENNTLYRGPSLAGPPLVAVDEADCATECSNQPSCTQWALCPANETQG